MFISYVLSFAYLAIYWNNHHHLLFVTERISGGVLWANMHLLFWLSLIPFATAWMGENDFAQVPTAVYGAVLLMDAIAYSILQRSIIHSQGRGLPPGPGPSVRDLKGKASPILYAIGHPGRALAALGAPTRSTFGVALMWIVPDLRIERAVEEEEEAEEMAHEAGGDALEAVRESEEAAARARDAVTREVGGRGA